MATQQARPEARLSHIVIFHNHGIGRGESRVLRRIGRTANSGYRTVLPYCARAIARNAPSALDT